jgi:hypothetical protein
MTTHISFNYKYSVVQLYIQFNFLLTCGLSYYTVTDTKKEKIN